MSLLLSLLHAAVLNSIFHPTFFFFGVSLKFLYPSLSFFLCRYQKHVHTYRILPDEEGFLAVQVQRRHTHTHTHAAKTVFASVAAGRQRCFCWLRALTHTHIHRQQPLCALCLTAVKSPPLPATQTCSVTHTHDNMVLQTIHVATSQTSVSLLFLGS